MKDQLANIQKGKVMIEGDELYYEVIGEGEPLLMVAGGGGDGDYYSAIADILCDEYKVIIYDRRANSRSTMNNPQNFEISQQSRDAVAVIHAVGEVSANVFGNSSGAVIALDIAKNHPQAVRSVVVHEAPASRMHPQAQKWQRFFASCYLTAFRFGSSVAALRWLLGIEVPIKQMIDAQMKSKEYIKNKKSQSVENRISSKVATDFLIKQELLPITNYLPDVELIKRNQVKMYIAVGKWAQNKNTWLAQISQILAAKLNCELVVFPGHHGGYMDIPEEFAAVLRSILKED